MKKRWQIFVVEDSDRKFADIEYQISSEFGSNAEITRVKTLAELKRVFSEQGNNFAFIVLDANLEDDVTLEFLDLTLAKKFEKPIIANSSNEDHRKTQMHFGCNHLGGPNLGKALADIHFEYISHHRT